jgi:hypothetical protein
MYRILLASTAIAALAAPLAAETISTTVTTPVRTSTIKAGTPDSITIAAAGTVDVNGGTAVTMDSDHAVANEGKIINNNVDGAVGISALAGTSGAINNSGTITVTESYTATDADNDGDLDGPFAVGSNRFGIRTEGAHSGNVVNSGTVTVEGNNSAGIWLGGPLDGNFTHNGGTNVLGNGSTAIRVEDISGNVRLAGSVVATGAGATAAHFTGDIEGALVVQGTVSATGYRFTTAPTDPSKLDADDLLQGGSALIIEGDVTGGIVLAIPPKDNSTTDTDEDDDGIADASEGSAAVVSYGAAPAMVIGAADRDIAIGAVASSGTNFGLYIDGAVSGQGLYTGVDGNGLVIVGAAARWRLPTACWCRGRSMPVHATPMPQRCGWVRVPACPKCVCLAPCSAPMAMLRARPAPRCRWMWARMSPPSATVAPSAPRRARPARRWRSSTLAAVWT